MDKELIKLCMNREDLEELAPHVAEYAVTQRTWSIIEYIKGYFKDHPTATEVTEGGLIAYMIKDTARIGEHEFKLLKAAVETTATTKEEDVNDLKKHYIGVASATEIYNRMNEYLTGRSSLGPDSVDIIVENYKESMSLATDTASSFVEPDISKVLASVSSAGLEWRLEELNISCGPIRKGDFIIVAAYVNTGKTTFAASEVSFMASQLPDDQCVIWINNEEDSDKVFFRILQATLGKTSKEIQADPAKCMAEYESHMGSRDRIKIINNSREFRKPEVLERLVKKYKPGLIVFDTMDKIQAHSWVKEERNRLGEVYNWARDLAHEYCPVIAISQTNATGETTKWITQSMLRESKNDKPAEGDLILCIGMDLNDPKAKKERYINVAKNKLFGGPRSKEAERDGKWTVEIDNERVRYVGKEVDTTSS